MEQRSNRTEMLNIRLTKQMKDQLEQDAKQSGFRTVTGYIIQKLGLKEHLSSGIKSNLMSLYNDEGKKHEHHIYLLPRHEQYIKEMKRTYGDLSESELCRRALDELIGIHGVYTDYNDENDTQSV